MTAMNRGRDPVRVGIVYEHSLFAHGIRRLLAREPRLEMVGMIERAGMSASGLKRLKADVVILEGNGGVAILESLAGVVGVAVSLRGDEATIFTGRLTRVSEPEELAKVIRAIARPRRRRAKTKGRVEGHGMRWVSGTRRPPAGASVDHLR